MSPPLRALTLATLLGVLSLPSLAQDVSTLHVTVVLADADGKPTPVPRHALLVSDNPATAPPRRVVTARDGTVDVKLRPGTYTVESDQPVAFNGKAYQWTELVEMAAGRDSALELTADNAEIGPLTSTTSTTTASAAPPEDDPSFLLPRWQDAVVTLWTPTLRASGFVVDSRGLVATNQRVIGRATSVAVQLTPTVKVAARVLVADPARDVAVLWIDPTVTSAVQPVPLECAHAAKSSVAEGQGVFTISVPLRGQRVLTSGRVSRVEAQAIIADFGLATGSTGGPVFTAGGALVGITTPLDETEGKRRWDSRVVGVEAACEVLASAEKKMREAAPPSGTRLPVEPSRPFPRDPLEDAASRGAGGLSPYQVSSSDYDITFITPVLAYAAQQRADRTVGRDRAGSPGSPDPPQERVRLLTDFGTWSEYVADVPPVLLVRLTPRLVEGFWTTVGRAAARTQGMDLPPIRRFKPGFSRMRTYCGKAEVTPIHPFTTERRVSENDAIVEGLYVFDPGALGPHCGTVTLVLYSAKEPEKGDTLVVDPKVIQQIWQDFAPSRTAEPERRPG